MPRGSFGRLNAHYTKPNRKAKPRCRAEARRYENRRAKLFEDERRWIRATKATQDELRYTRTAKASGLHT